jgi:Protein of unknown function (Hypoth_ymh)
LTNSLMDLFPSPDLLLSAAEIEVERAVLRVYSERTDDPLRRMTTAQVTANELFEREGYPYDVSTRNAVDRVISRVSKKLEDAGLIEAPDPDNGKSGYRVISKEGRKAMTEIDYGAAKVRSGFTREMFHPSLPDAAWNSFRSGDYDTAVFEAFKAVEVAVLKKGLGKNGIIKGDHGVSLMQKAFDPKSGPLTDMSARPPSRKNRRCELFTGAFGELRNPKAHGDPTITDPLVAVEEMTTAGTLQRIVDNA